MLFIREVHLKSTKQYDYILAKKVKMTEMPKTKGRGGYGTTRHF